MPSPWPSTPPTAAHRASYADAVVASPWLEDLPARAPHPPAAGTLDCDLCVVGGGFTGLWTALHAVADDPARCVVLLERERCGTGASGRNGGFVSASLTHGVANGLARFAREMPALERLGLQNFEALRADLVRLGVDAEWETPGELTVALEDHEVDALAEQAALLTRFGHDVELLDGAAVRAQVRSPMYRAALLDRTGTALVHPARLADGLRRAAVAAGVQVCEHTPVCGLRTAGAGVAVATGGGATVRARRVVLATSAYPPVVRAIRRYVAPVYDHALMTEPLTEAQWSAVGWAGRQGISDMANRFHYYRPTRDGRILWGGWDAVYRPGGPVDDAFDDHDATFAVLAQHFFATFPQLEGSLRFAHRWGGAIDTCSRFSVFFGTALRGRVAYAAGYTGLGVGAARFGARVALDLADGRATEATRLRYVRRRPVPFPPEPLRHRVIAHTQRALAAADAREGRRGLWLRTLDRLGLGFDS